LLSVLSGFPLTLKTILYQFIESANAWFKPLMGLSEPETRSKLKSEKEDFSGHPKRRHRGYL
jgi:hypothetical protein